MSFGTLRQWHWVSSAVALVGLVLFAITGITLNHAHQIPAQKSSETREGQLPLPLLSSLERPELQTPTLPRELRHAIKREVDVFVPANKVIEWFDEEIYIALPRPGGDAWLSIDLTNGEVIYEQTSRGAIAYLNDLHKGRNTGVVWSWFIDIFAVACLVFSMTGLWLLFRLQKHRPSTWPAVAFGVLVPLLIIILFVH